MSRAAHHHYCLNKCQRSSTPCNRTFTANPAVEESRQALANKGKGHWRVMSRNTTHTTFICVCAGQADPDHLWGTSFKVMATAQQLTLYTVILPSSYSTVLWPFSTRLLWEIPPWTKFLFFFFFSFCK